MPKSFEKDNWTQALEQFIPFPKMSKPDQSEINAYVQAFSIYLCRKDDAYYYNYSFLVQQNHEFQDFLHKADLKSKSLGEFMVRLKQLAQFQTFLTCGDGADSISISINNLWKMDIVSEKCSLIDNFSVGGADCGPSGDLITLRYKDRTFGFSPSIDDKSLEQIAEILLNAVAGREDNDE